MVSIIRIEEKMKVLIIRGGFFLFIFLLIHLWIRRVMDTEENNERMEESIEAIQQSYTEFQEKIDAARKYRHDIPKHLHMMEEVMSESCKKQYCNNDMLNTIACMKEEKCLEYNISIIIDIGIKEASFLDRLPMEKVDISGVIQNLLDNAIEECCRIPKESERESVWTINETSDGIKMQVENTCRNAETIDFTTKKEDKKTHGWGVKIIKERISIAGGTIEYITKNADKICAEVYIPFVRTLDKN